MTIGDALVCALIGAAGGILGAAAAAFVIIRVILQRMGPILGMFGGGMPDLSALSEPDPQLRREYGR